MTAQELIILLQQIPKDHEISILLRDGVSGEIFTGTPDSVHPLGGNVSVLYGRAE